MNLKKRVKLNRAISRLEWIRPELEEIERTKQELAYNHGLERNAKFDRAWEIAWSLGHASGFSEVRSYFDELADLIKP